MWRPMLLHRDLSLRLYLLLCLVPLLLLLVPPAAASQDAVCTDPEIVATCPLDTLIPYAEFVASWPAIEYCVSDAQGFLPVPREACESLAQGTWRVRPEWAARAAGNQSIPLAQQYVCAVCAARNASALAPTEPAVWILSLANKTGFLPQTFATWGSRLGDVRLDQLMVAASGRRYLFALAPFHLVQKLVRDARWVLAAMPLPPELKISPRVADHTSTQTGQDGAATVLSIRTLISSQEDVGRRATHHDHGLRVIHKALGLPLSPSLHRAAAAVAGQEAKHDAADDDEAGVDGPEEEEEMEAMSSSCADCTVEAAGEGNYVVSSVPVAATAEVASTISQALASTLVIDVAVRYQLFNKEANNLLQSGTNTSSGGSTWLWRQGLMGEGAVVGVADTGLDVQSCFFHDSAYPVAFRLAYDDAVGDDVPVFQSAGHRKIREYYGFADRQEGINSGHGTHVCGSAVGYPAEMVTTSKGYAYRGAAYASKLAFFDIGRPGDDFLYLPFDLTTGLWPRTYGLGGRVHSNSWGSSIADNSVEMHQTDAYLWRNQDFVILYAAGNDGPETYTIGTPASSKNSIAVGATTNNVAVPDLAFFSSRGPTFDTRFGIDVVAPGFYVSSAYSQVNAAANQCFIQGMAGTSMAAPLMAGTTVLLREYFTRGFYPLGWPSPDHAFVPMGALLKAVLINSALELTGPEATKHNTDFIKYPNYAQGYGMVAAKFATYFQGEANPNMLFVDGTWTKDCTGCPKLTQGRAAFYTLIPTRNSPIKITLAYYDYPAAITSTTRILVNDLDLTATHDNTRFYANGWTNTGGPNSLNNVEQVIIPTPVVGLPITVKIAAASVAVGPQPYALAITGHFRKDYTLFNAAVPVVTSVATDGAQALVMGRNLPRTTQHPQSFVWTCDSDPLVKMDAAVVAYSPATAQFLVVNFNTTECAVFRVQVVSDGFVGNVSQPLAYAAAPISTFCANVAGDDTCWTLIACAGHCLQQQGGGAANGLDTFHIALYCVLGVALFLGACVWAWKWYARQREEWYEEAEAARRRPTAKVAGLADPDDEQLQEQQGQYVAYASPGRTARGGGEGSPRETRAD